MSQHIPAPYSCIPETSRGRLYPEPESNTRSCFQRDRDRIIHSAAFRRLEYKTQVFVNHEGDHYRTRLTHSLEVSQMARSICRSLGLNEDLAETLALAHDLGHTPFGHAGEDGLSEAMAPFGGFDHNGHTLRIITSLEQRYAEFDGLNLTWETLEGIAKHNGPLVVHSDLCLVPSEEAARHKALGTGHSLPRAILEYNEKHDLALATYASAEAQVASLSDDIAYNNHDIDDGLRAGLFTIADLDEVPGVAASFHAVRKLYPTLAEPRVVHESIRRVINRMVTDLIVTSQANIEAAQVKTVDDIRNLGRPLIAFSDGMVEQNRQLKAFLMRRMYRHYKVNRMASKAERVVKELFEFFLAEPECLPTGWRALTDAPGTEKTAKVSADFIAGMTDRFALQEHRRFFDLTPELR